MPAASNLQTSFLGGEISQSFQGRYDRPDYKISLSTCLNWFPIETGALVRRGGTQFCGTTRGANPGRNIAFDVAGSNPIYMEFTDLFLRFRLGASLVTTNDSQTVTAISAANPAVVTTATNNGWTTGNSVIFSNLGTGDPLLQNRVFTITTTGANTFSIADAITGATIDGSTLGAFVSGKVSRILEIATSYGSQSWQAIRSVQTETQAILLNGIAQPQILALTAVPTAIQQPTFTLTPSNFLDGPYLDPPNGSIVTYNLQVGNITLTFSFNAWSATTSYNIGDYVLSGGNGYKSIVNANLNNTPPNASFWLPVQGGDPVGPQGFTAGDIGRLIRLFSEPSAWNSGTAYVSGNVVKFNNSYWQAIASSTNVTPGTDATKWSVVSGAAFALWTWGRILSVSGTGLIAPGVAIGNYTSLSAAFDGVTSQVAASSANAATTVATHPVFNVNTVYNTGDIVYYSGNFYQLNSTPGYIIFNGSLQSNCNTNEIWNATNLNTYFRVVAGVSSTNNVGPPSNPAPGVWSNLGANNPTNTNVWTNLGAAPSASLDVYAGQDFHTSAKVLAFANVFPASDSGFGTNMPTTFTLNLRAKHTLPASASDGTIIGTSGAISNTTSPVTITSTDTVTAWEYFWIEMTATRAPPLPDGGSHTFTMTTYLAEAQFFAANVANGSVVVIQLAGPALLYPNTATINTWRPGVYSNRVGWPTCGTYMFGRLWLSGVVDNRIDSSVSNQIFNFAPTGIDGTVAANNGISIILNAPDTNPVLWMVPDLQGIIAGTQKREWLIQPASSASGIAPTNIQANPVTHLGSANIEPRRTEHTLVFVQKHQRKILEAFPDVFSGKFTAPNLLDKARHLTVAAIQEIAYQQELTPTIWARNSDGSLFGLTYRRDTLMTSQGPTFYAPHRHALGSGRVVESITVGPTPDGTLDALMMVTNDTKTGQRHVELMTQFFEETSLLQNAWQLDDAVTPTSFTINNASPAPYGGLTINGLWHLNGKTVQVFAGGLDCGVGEGGVISDFVVSNGSVTVPFGDGVSAGSGGGLFTAAFVNSFVPTIPIVVGFTFNSDGQRVRPVEPPETGARNGPALGKLRRNHKYGLQVVNATGLNIGTDFSHIDIVYPESSALMKVPVGTLFSGIIREALDDPYGFDGEICWRVSRPWPAMITAISGFLETQDE